MSIYLGMEAHVPFDLLVQEGALVFPKWMVSSCLQQRLPPNLNRELCPVSVTGTARWRGIVPMAKLPEALRVHSSIATHLGGFPVSMVISHTRSHATTRCRRLTKAGASRKGSRACSEGCSPPLRPETALLQAQCRFRSWWSRHGQGSEVCASRVTTRHRARSASLQSPAWLLMAAGGSARLPRLVTKKPHLLADSSAKRYGNK